MAETVGSVEVEVRANLDKLKSGLADAEKETKKFEATTADASKQVEGGLGKAATSAAKTTDKLTESLGGAQEAARILGDTVSAATRKVTGFSGVGMVLNRTIRSSAAPALAGIGAGVADVAAEIGGLRIAFGLLGAAAVGYAGLALGHVVSTNHDIELSLQGIGRASGATIDDIRNIGASVSTWTGLTTSGARDVAKAFASVGTIAKENIQPATEITRAFATTLRVDVPTANQALARGLGGSAKEMEDLLARVGGLNQGLKEQIEFLVNSGQQAAAQSLVIRELGKNTVDTTTDFEKGWNAVKNIFASSADAVGEFLILNTDVGRKLGATNQQQLEYWKTVQEGAQRNVDFFGKLPVLGDLARAGFESATKSVEEYTQKIEEAAAASERARANIQTLQIGAALEQVAPQRTQLQQTQATIQLLRNGLQQMEQTEEAAFFPGRVEDFKRAIDILTGSASVLEKTLSGLDPIIERLQDAGRAAAAISPSQKAQAAYDHIYHSVEASKGPIIAAAAAEQARQNVLTGITTQLSQQAKLQVLQATQRTELAGIELSAVGKIATEQQRIVSLAQARFQAEQESLRVYGDTAHVDEKKLAAIQAQINAQAQLNQLKAAATQRDELQFQLSQVGRTDVQQQVYQQLRSAGVDINTQQGQINANLIQTIEYFKQAKDASTEFLGSFIKDMLHGQSATQALGNALARLADRLVDMATNQLISGLFGALIKGVTGGIGGPLSLIGSAVGGGVAGGLGRGPLGPLYHAGGLVGSTGVPQRRITRLHAGADLASDEVFAILQKGEKVVPRNQNQAPSQPIVFNQTFNNTDPSMRAWITQQQQLWAKQVRAQTPGDVGKYKSNNPGYLAGTTV